MKRGNITIDVVVNSGKAPQISKGKVCRDCEHKFIGRQLCDKGT